MSKSDQSDWKAQLPMASKVLLGMAGLSFLIGGGIIHAIWGIGRWFAEAFGMVAAVVFGVVAMMIKSAFDK